MSLGALGGLKTGFYFGEFGFLGGKVAIGLGQLLLKVSDFDT